MDSWLDPDILAGLNKHRGCVRFCSPGEYIMRSRRKPGETEEEWCRRMWDAMPPRALASLPEDAQDDPWD